MAVLDEKTTRSFTASDIKWIKNVKNDEENAYFEAKGDFIVHSSTRDLLNVNEGELLILYQSINGKPHFHHLVTPVDDVLEEEKNTRHSFRRKFRTVAVATYDDAIKKENTSWRKVNFQGIGQGKVCRLSNVDSIDNLKYYQDEMEKIFKPFLVEDFKKVNFQKKEYDLTPQMIGALRAYQQELKSSDWIDDETYKFEFANYVFPRVNFDKQTDEEILTILEQSQKIKYSNAGNIRGIQFILKSGSNKPGEFIKLKDVENFRKIITSIYEELDWSEKIMSYTGLSTWLATLFPQHFYPIPIVGFDKTIQHLFQSGYDLNKVGMKYQMGCYPFMKMTEEILRDHLFETPFLDKWNFYFENNPELDIEKKERLEKIDWIWLVQDFHLFVLRNILKEFPSKEIKIQPEDEPTTVEGESKLAIHLRKERDQKFIRKVKQNALAKNIMLNCVVCGFSFLETYGNIGGGFIEAHHLNPLSKQSGPTTTKESDIALVCSNCHRMLHKGNPVFSLDELKKMMKENRTK